MEITELLKRMKVADEPRLKAEREKIHNPNVKRTSSLTDKQKYIRGLVGYRK